MGYYSTFEIAWNTELDPKEVAVELERISDGYTFEQRCQSYGKGERELQKDRIYSDDAYKWYDAKDHVKELSKQYPGTMFTLYREGEEAGDIEKTFYKDGKAVGGGKAKIVLPEPPE